MSGEQLHRREVFQVLVVRNDIIGVPRRFKVVAPDLEGLEDSKEFFVVCIIVKLCSSEGAAVVCDWVDVVVIHSYGEDASDGVVGGIGFDYRRKRWVEVVEDRSQDERLFEEPEGLFAGGRPGPFGILSRESS